ncbi:MAG: lipopolysaccharide/colanic/teichoic acid biosynthesis glycosyltransferase [Candidatus Promineifilaceae bacterium]|jgi:lipopolysaccharide/colanic/teichoic acid biosynthesis glycosyltransferase/glycosyltransferase involved in cell wall biosynthesis
MKISVVIPAYNAEKTLAQCLEALRHQTVGEQLHEVIVVDNNSKDETTKVAQQFEEVTVLFQPKRGASAARNMGIAHATGDIVCFTDSDCRPTSTWLEELARALEESPELLAVKGTYLTEQKEIVARFVQIEYEDKYDLLRPQKYINFVDTYSAAFWRNTLFENDGGFHEGFTFAEDRELAFRLASRGYKMAFQPDAVVYHLHSHTLRGYFKKKFFNGYWTALIVKRFPQRGVKDSHTPQVQKVQMMLVILLAASLFGLLFIPLLNWLLPQLPWGWLGLSIPTLLLVFLASTIPFVIKAWGKDKALALASPHMLFVRACALSCGYLWGIIRPIAIDDTNTAAISGLGYFLKRGLDILGSIVGLVLTALIFPFIAIAIKSNSNGPVVFKQTRVGNEGKTFTLYKFRSMYNNAEDRLDASVDLEKHNHPAYKIKHDPRITKVGAWLRRWSLDELPQFWNVLKGEMSLIGPRPEQSQSTNQDEGDYRRRLMVKPGMVSPLQIAGQENLPLEERTAYELDYIENYSLWTDVVLILKIVPNIINRQD